jgi:hypothetical protein
VQLQVELKRKAAQLDLADNKIQQLSTELAREKAQKAELLQVCPAAPPRRTAACCW